MFFEVQDLSSIFKCILQLTACFMVSLAKTPDAIPVGRKEDEGTFSNALNAAELLTRFGSLRLCRAHSGVMDKLAAPLLDGKSS